MLSGWKQYIFNKSTCGLQMSGTKLIWNIVELPLPFMKMLTLAHVKAIWQSTH